MYLKCIELYGFKSFANRTKIEFYPGINIIVGPNGCGKSNIVDAIRWSIGEMSRKALRMPSITDVIFAGTFKRQQMNLAEVTLVFDNTERKLPIHFDEVAITRKIYRTEESEYFINRISCRLKDIKEMFLDTGIGSNGYAVIDQGEIDEILIADAVERREVFEEVAGISRYRAKREETIAKLEKVSVDLSIVENSVALIEQQIKKLEQDAKKAKLRQQYMEELRDLEIASIVKSIASLYSMISEEEKLLKPVINEIAEIQIEVSKIDAEKSKKELELDEKNNVNKGLSEKIVSTRLEISQTEGKIISNEEMIKEIRSNIDHLSHRHAKNVDTKTLIIPKIDELKKELDIIKNDDINISAEYERISDECKQYESKIEEIDRFIADGEHKTVEQYQKEIELSNMLTRLESEMAHTDEDISSAFKDRQKVSYQIDLLDNELKKLETELYTLNQIRTTLDNEAIDAAMRKKNLEDELLKVEEENKRISLDIVSLESRLDALIKDAEKDSYWLGTKTAVNSAIEGVEGVLRNLIKFKGESKAIMEDILGEAVDAVVVRDRETALKCVEHIRNTGKGRARFIVLSNIPPLSPPSDIVDAFFEFPEKYRNLMNYLTKGFTVDGSTVASEIWVCGGVEDVSSNEPYWAELDEIKRNIESLKESKTRNDSLILKIKEDIVEIERRISDIESRINEAETQMAVKKNMRLNLDEKRKITYENLKFIEVEISKFENIKNEITKKIEDTKKELELVKSIGARLRQDAEDLKKRRAELEKLLIEKKGQLASIKHKKDSISQNIASLSFSLSSLEKQIENINIEESEYSRSLLEMENRVKALEDENKNLAVKREELLNDLKELDIQKTLVESEMSDIRNYLAHLNTTLKENNEIIRERFDKKNEIELRINTYKTRIDDLKNRLETEYLVGYDDVKDKYLSVGVDEKRVEYLKKRIDNIGPVNMTAPTEYEELMKEYDEKMRQINDLKQARDDLKQAISKINQTTKENLKTTFDKVNEHFKKIYSTLFNGGTAKLIFTDPDNILESGIEIVACPPGKKLVNISQFSGGEKSLTAIALLFSFFCVNPSPFCVMDEVDAALDESNVERFVNMLKSFAPSTQFIVITHNKRTMEVGDRIYGVTMEEMGVSKVISVDLKRAVSMVEENTIAV
ncbi:MAG: AAA family ATPase [Elusimicrobiales bacterium]